TTPGVDDARTHILALFVGPTAPKWNWAVDQLLHHIEHRSRRRYHHERGPEFIKLLAENLKPLSLLAGFDPDTPTLTWWAEPTHALRFAEVLVKIYASHFTVGELVFLFTADPHLDGDDPFALDDDEETFDMPLELPDEVRGHSLQHLRR